MPRKHPGFRLFILGAGFSKPAGLPLGSKLFSLVKESIEHRFGKESRFHRDLENYLEYKGAFSDLNPTDSTIDIESLISFWDIEHFLQLRGSKTYSDEGNESQLMVRRALGEVIHLHTPKIDKLPAFYYDFAKSLSTKDIVITFNYDIVLERALEHVGKPYRLFPRRNNELTERDEVIILKLHGSVDWFSNKAYLRRIESLKESGYSNYETKFHTVFNDPQRYEVLPIVDELRHSHDPILNIHRIRLVDTFYLNDNDPLNVPFLLSPSNVKFLYAQPILDFWNGLGRVGESLLGLSIIGFSMPEHDEYIHQTLYQIISNYQDECWEEGLFSSLKKDFVKFVDLQNEEENKEKYKKRYSFSKPDKSLFWFEGFSQDAVDFLFSQHRKK